MNLNSLANEDLVHIAYVPSGPNFSQKILGAYTDVLVNAAGAFGLRDSQSSDKLS
jgi:hypothetical protein